MSRGLRTALIAVAAVAAWLAVAWAGDRGRAAGRPVAGVVRDAEGRAIPAVEIEVEGLPKSWRHGRRRVRRQLHRLLPVRGDRWRASGW